MDNPSNQPTNKQKILLPTVALVLEFFPFVFFFLSGGNPGGLLLMLLSPIAGLVLGVSLASKSKAEIGAVGKVLSIIAVVLPLAWISFLVLFFVGAATGLISFM